MRRKLESLLQKKIKLLKEEENMSKIIRGQRYQSYALKGDGAI